MNVERARALLSNARELAEQARDTDYIMPVTLPFIPVIIVIIGALVMVIGFVDNSDIMLAIGSAIALIGLVVNFYVVYRWVKRRNDHFDRTLKFFGVITELAEILGFERASIIRSRYNELREICSIQRNPVMHTILTIIPFYIFYVYHFLNKDFAEHSAKERLLLADLFDELRKRHPQFIRRIEEFRRVPPRSTLMYLILTLVTSLFSLYWVYTLTKDPNEHFKSHKVIERDIVDAFEKLVEQRAAGAGAEAKA